jgi:heterodisulfide reductase subunit C
MDYVQAVVRGDIEKVSELSFDCLSCGLCAARCPAEITQFNVALLARRIYGKYLSKKGKFVETRIKEIEEGKYEEGYKELANMPKDDLKKKYFERDLNFDIT